MIILGNFLVINLFIICLSNAYPIEKKHLNVNESKNEKRYPNGTVIGKYTYKDKEGNPIHVKYYADDSSYGVELKSLRVLDHNLPDTRPILPDKTNFELQLKTIPPLNITDSLLPYNNLKFEKAFEILADKKPTKSEHRSEYEIYTENEVKPEKCSNERVRVYYEKDNKRKIRNALDPYETFRFCEQF